MPGQAEPLKAHVLRRVFRMLNKHGRPVTFREIYMTSSRGREAVAEALQELVDEGTVTQTYSSQGRGRPTHYFHLANEWIQQDPDFRSGEQFPRLIDTGRSAGDADLSHREPEDTRKSQLQELLNTDDWDEFFQAIGPHIWCYVRDHQDTTRDGLIKAMLGSNPDPEDRRKFSIAYGRLTDPAYDEYWTEWWISQEQPKSEATGMKDRRAKPRLKVNDEPPPRPFSDHKSIQMGHAQRRVLIHTKATAESMHYPDPNDDLPDMSRFAATVKSLSA